MARRRQQAWRHTLEAPAQLLLKSLASSHLNWVWEEMRAISKVADVHSFHQLYDGKFLCENEPGKYIDPDIGLDEYSRKTIWIGMPPGIASSQETRSTNLIGEFGGSVPTGNASYWYEKERIPAGYIAAIGLELQTHDNRGEREIMLFIGNPIGRS